MNLKLYLSFLISAQCFISVQCFLFKTGTEAAETVDTILTPNKKPETDGPRLRTVFRVDPRDQYITVNENSNSGSNSELNVEILSIDLSQEIDKDINTRIAHTEVMHGEKSEPDEPLPEEKNIMSVSLMNSGIYAYSPKYNSLIDGIARNVKKDFKKREMDPLFFSVGGSGSISHATSSKTKTPQEPDAELTKKNKRIGAGVLLGLLSLKRNGNVESRKNGNAILVRSDFYFGPLDVDLVFENLEGLRIVNTTLPRLVVHALFEISGSNNTVTLKEFVTENPKADEIQQTGTKNQRFQNVGKSATLRLFRTGGRMELRMLRSFKRAVSRKITEVKAEKLTSKNNNQQSPLL